MRISSSENISHFTIRCVQGGSKKLFKWPSKNYSTLATFIHGISKYDILKEGDSLAYFITDG